MRINNFEKDKIIQYTKELFGSKSKVYLFGSRVDDSKRGGDIDVYIEPYENNIRKNYLKNRLWAKLQLALDEQKIDIVIANEVSLDIDKEALTTGVLLNE